MFSTITEMDPRGPLVNLVIWLVLVILTYRLIRHPSKLQNFPLFLPFFFIIVFLLYAMYGGDYFRYKEMVEMMHYSLRDIESITNQESKEPIYWYLSMLLNYNYILFRTVVFVGAFCFSLLSIKIHHISISSYLVFFIIACLLSFSVSRVCLASSMALLGFSFILNNSELKSRRIVLAILGILFFLCSFFFHKSIVFLMAILLLSLIPLKKKMIAQLMIISPIITFLIGSIFVTYLLSSGDSESTFNFKSAQSYAINEKSYGIGTTLMLLLSYIYYCFIFVFSLRFIFSQKSEKAPTYIKCLSRATFWIILISVLFWFIPGIEALMFCNRFITFSQLVVLPVLAYSLQYGINYQSLKKIYNIAFVWESYTLVLTFIGKMIN